MEKTNIEKLAENKFANVRILVEYDDYDIKNDTRLLIPFSHHQHIGFMNKDGDVVVEAKYDWVIGSCRNNSDVIKVGEHYTYGFNRVTKEPSTYLGTKWGLLDSKGNVILDTNYLGIRGSDDNRIFTLRHMDYQYEVVNLDGRVIIPKGIYDWIDTYDNGFTRVISGGPDSKKYGLIDDTGKEVLPLIYSSIWNFCKKNLSSVRVEYIDDHGIKRIGKFTFSTRKLEF